MLVLELISQETQNPPLAGLRPMSVSGHDRTRMLTTGLVPSTDFKPCFVKTKFRFSKLFAYNVRLISIIHDQDL